MKLDGPQRHGLTTMGSANVAVLERRREDRLHLMAGASLARMGGQGPQPALGRGHGVKTDKRCKGVPHASILHGCPLVSKTTGAGETDGVFRVFPGERGRRVGASARAGAGCGVSGRGLGWGRPMRDGPPTGSGSPEEDLLLRTATVLERAPAGDPVDRAALLERLRPRLEAFVSGRLPPSPPAAPASSPWRTAGSPDTAPLPVSSLNGHFGLPHALSAVLFPVK